MRGLAPDAAGRRLAKSLGAFIPMAHAEVSIRHATIGDLPEVESMLRSYMAEALNRSWEGSRTALERDGLGREFHTLIALRNGEAIAVAYWHRIYNVTIASRAARYATCSLKSHIGTVAWCTR
jgi:hypothetical protein